MWHSSSSPTYSLLHQKPSFLPCQTHQNKHPPPPLSETSIIGRMNLCNCLVVVGQKKMMQDPAIKLFGKEIPLSSNDGGGDDVSCSDTSSVEKEDRGEEQEVETEKKKLFPAEAAESMQLSNGIDTLPDSVTIQATSIDEKETEKLKSSKIVKKPDKILPCPRCNSKNTKFCYYNNYNANQPRHFCRSCQRYWTAGGTMRNMPVGAGRRKTKISSSHYHQITISEALQAAQMDVAANGIHHPGLKYHDGIILKSGGFDPLIHDSRASMLPGTNKKVPNGTTNGFRSPKSGKRCSSNSNGENCDDRSNDSTVSTLSSNNEGTVNMNFHPEIPGIPGIPWTCLWNYPAILPPPTLCPPGFSIPFHPSTSLNCNFLSYLNFPSPVTSNSVPDSPTLGKCARDEEVLHLQNPMKRRKTSVLVPKTLRVDNPTDVAKSTIWSTLGINNDSLCSEGGFFKVRSAGKISPALVSNPAALSRSLNFVESSSA